MSGTPIKYDSETFNTILVDINSDPELVDKPDWFKTLIAGLGDVLSVQRNATANNGRLRTAFTRGAVSDLCALIDYQIRAQQTSSGTLLFYLNPDTVTFPVTIVTSDLKATSRGTSIKSQKKFEARAPVTVASFSEVFTADAGTDKITASTERRKYDLLRFTTTGALPGGLSTGTNYYAIKVSATEIRVATSIANAVSGSFLDITSAGTGTHTLHLYSFPVTAYQQESVSTIVVGTSDGSTEWQEFDLPDLLILSNTISVTINSFAYTLITSFIDSISTDRHFKHLFKSDGASYIQFGNGTYGAIPPAFDLEVAYAKGGGADSNITGDNKISIYAGANADVNGVTNITDFTGGADEESIESAKRIAPILLKARDRFITSLDGKGLAENFEGVSIVSVYKNFYGVLSAKISVVPNGGGLPSSQLKSDLEAYLTERTILEEPYIQVEDPVYVTVNSIVQVKVRPGYAFADVSPYVRLALKLSFTENAQDIQDEYLSNGITSTVDLINVYLSESFTSADYDQITELLNNMEAVIFGKTIQEVDVMGYIDSNVFGVDYVTNSMSFPIALAQDEITTVGTITITQIP